MGIDRIETHRLYGERICPAHWQTWRGVGADPRVMATLGGVWSEEEARKKLEWNCRQWDENGHGLWMFFLRTTGGFAGRCGIRRMSVNGTDEIELGYAVVPALWGQGLAAEMGVAALDIAFKAFDYASVVAFTLVENKPSQRVMQKLGLAYEGRIEHAGRPHVLYRRRNPDGHR